METQHEVQVEESLEHCTKKKMVLMFSHRLTPEQEKDAREIGIERFVPMREDILAAWGNVPAELELLSKYLEPAKNWLAWITRPGDYVLVQGDYGATFEIVKFAKQNNLNCVYATTEKQSVDVAKPDGTVEKKSIFKHVRFRNY